MNRTTSTTVAVALAVLSLSSCAKGTEATAPAAVGATPVAATTTTTDSGNFPTQDPADLETTPVVEDTPDPVLEGKFGEAGSFSQDGSPFEVTVNTGKKAKCHYDGIGCDKPQTGDRFVNVPITVKNAGTDALELDPDMFAMEYADGTRMSWSDGPTYQYGPDNVLESGQKVRPGGTLKTSLTFEAPKGSYRIVLLSDSSGSGDDLFLWK